jgi:hypothetical protein
MSITVTFINETDLPVMVEGWKEIMVGLNKLNSVLVLPGEEIYVSALTGEWFVTTFFKERKYNNLWTLKNIHNLYQIGKFRKKSCFRGDYSWMDTNQFTITREEGDIFRFNYSK